MAQICLLESSLMRLGIEVIIGVLGGWFDDCNAWIGLEICNFSSCFVKLHYGA